MTNQMISRGFIQLDSRGRFLEPEHEQVRHVLESQGVAIAFFNLASMDSLVIPQNCVVIGDHNAMKAAFRKVNKTVPSMTSYPSSLKQFLRRNVMQTTVGDIRRVLTTPGMGLSQPMFVKPMNDSKAFTGCMVATEDDIYKLQGLSKKTRIHCSPGVSWQSEYRVFVLNGNIVGVRHYSGNDAMQLDMDIVEKCVETLQSSDQSTSAYGIDFGVLDTGETALVEWNDGFALGSYGLDSKVYTRILVTRWLELTVDRSEKLKHTHL